jgi:hypothetical protein
MDSVTFPFIYIFIGFLGVLQWVWYIAVIVFLVKIWSRVRHLPPS